MNYSTKLRTLPSPVGLNMTHPVLLGIYELLFAKQPEESNLNTLVKDIQQKLKVDEDKPGLKTWRALHCLITGNENVDFERKTVIIDPESEAVLHRTSKEIAPFVKELIRLAEAQEMYVRLMSSSKKKGLGYFGLAFDIGIFDKDAKGNYNYNGNLLLYANAARLAESIGLTWAGNANRSRFELRPAWALKLTDKQMMKELHRRKKAGLSLLATG